MKPSPIRVRGPVSWTAVLVLPVLLMSACRGDDEAVPDSSDRPDVVVTTGILGDVVAQMLGDAADVRVIMPPGASPHDFQASAQEAAAMREADVLVVNGAGFEEGLLSTIEGAEADGVDVFEAASTVSARPSQDGADPHFFTDPVSMAQAAQAIADHLLSVVPALDTEAVRGRVDSYLSELRALDDEVATTLAAVPERRRVLVTNHDVFGAFADRYDFDVIGVIVPGGGTSGSASGGALAALAETIEQAGVPAIFVDTSSPTDLADALAAEVGDVEVVALHSESLGEEGSEAGTYVGMVRVNARRIAEALVP